MVGGCSPCPTHLLAQERALVAHADAAVDDLEPRRVVSDAVAALGVVHLREGGKRLGLA